MKAVKEIIMIIKIVKNRFLDPFCDLPPNPVIQIKNGNNK